MKITIECTCGVKETISVENRGSDYFEKFTLWSTYDDIKVYSECNTCGEIIEIRII